MTRFLFALILMTTSLWAWAAPDSWNFKVYLDDKPIGYQRFTLSEQSGVREMSIEASFNVRFYALFSYHYAHEATERWNGNCLVSLIADTDDDGKKSSVKAVVDHGAMKVSSPSNPKAQQQYKGCVMTFAYWNPEMLKQSRLLNSQTGDYETVKVDLLGKEPIVVRGAQVSSNHYRISGTKHPINLWYSDAGEWLALMSPLDGGRQLIYRLE